VTHWQPALTHANVNNQRLLAIVRVSCTIVHTLLSAEHRLTLCKKAKSSRVQVAFKGGNWATAWRVTSIKTASAAALLADNVADDVAEGDAPGVLLPVVLVVRGATAAASRAL
jgi:hypothetical protein